MDALSRDEIDEVHPQIRPLVIAAWKSGDEVPESVKHLTPDDLDHAVIALELGAE